jgi:transcriptional regulator with XRE-family HTH domain
MTMQQNRAGTSPLLAGPVNHCRQSGRRDYLLYRTPPKHDAERRIGAAACSLPPYIFGNLLRHHRSAARMTQEVLAERARVSVRCVSDLERGINSRPHRDTLQALVRALRLSPDEEDTFRAAARWVPLARLRHDGVPQARGLESREVWFPRATERMTGLYGVVAALYRAEAVLAELRTLLTTLATHSDSEDVGEREPEIGRLLGQDLDDPHRGGHALEQG